MKGIIVLICLGFFMNANAARDYDAAQAVDSATEIMWYNCDTGEGILYARFDAFFKLKDTVKEIVSSPAIGVHDAIDPETDYSYLYFRVEQPEPRWRVAALLDDTLVMAGNVYQFDKQVMDNWRYHNNQRISRNEAFEREVEKIDDESLNHCGIKKRSN